MILVVPSPANLLWNTAVGKERQEKERKRKAASEARQQTGVAFFTDEQAENRKNQKHLRS